MGSEMCIRDRPWYGYRTAHQSGAGEFGAIKTCGSGFYGGPEKHFGGELSGYTELLHESREEALQRMVSQAEKVGANAVLNVRFSTSSIASGAAEIFVYGSAVILVSDV